jgi:hypothetical protein
MTRLRPLLFVLALVLVAAAVVAGPAPVGPSAAQAATCAGYANQAAAQRAADTRDADGDGVYCESLSCPCLTPGSASTSPPPPPAPPPAVRTKSSCSRPSAVQSLRFSAAKYPNISRHTRLAIAHGWPSVMVLNRRGTDQRRDRLLQGVPTRSGFDRDEYPAAVGRGRANGSRHGLVRGTGPTGWKADVMYVPSSENRSHGSSMGAKLRRFCEGTRFRYVFR